MTAANVSLTKGSRTITIATAPTDEENLTKPIKVITFPTTTAGQGDGTGSRTSKIVDLAQSEQRITIDGWLSTGVGTSDTNNTATGKKGDLKQMFLDGGTFNMTYEGSTFSVNMDKLSIKRSSADNKANLDGVAEYSVKFTAIRGENL